MNFLESHANQTSAVALARLEATAEIAAAKANGTVSTSTVTKRSAEDLEPRAVWERMNDAPGSLFYSGDFE